MRFPQTITYWAPGSVDEFGDTTVATPVTMKGKWEERAELFLGPDGEEKRGNTVVYLDSDVVNGGFLAQGDQTAQADPLQVSGSIKIKDYRKIGDATRNLDFERRAIG